MLEANTNYSVGRGTDAPFEQIGADWIQGAVLAQTLNMRFIPGLRVYPTRFRPAESNFSGKQIEGVRFLVTDREAFDSTRLGIEVAVALQHLYPGKLDFDKCRGLIANAKTIQELKTSSDAGAIWGIAQKEAERFAERRKAFLLY